MGCAILHAFNWTFDEITANIPVIKKMGYHAVLTSPISYSKGDEWWMRYQPIDFRLIYSPLGTKKSFTQLIAKAKEYGMKIYVDVVINHMEHRLEGEPLDYPGNKELVFYSKNNKVAENKLYGTITENQFSSEDFNPKEIIKNYSNVDEIRNCRIQDERVPNGLPDFKINDWVINQQKQYLQALIKIGVEGFRIDAAKHVPVAHLQGIIDEQIRSSAYVFAEVIPEQSYIIMREVIEHTSISLYDFPLFFVIKRAFDWGGSFRQLEKLEKNSMVEKFRAITFVNTHDIPNNHSMKNLLFHSIEDEMLAYLFIFGRDGGCPLLFTDKGDNLNAVDSYNNRWKDLYKNPEIEKMLYFHNYSHSAKMKFVYVNDGVMVCERLSKGFFAINKNEHHFEQEIEFNSLNGKYTDLFGGGAIAIKNNKCLLKLAGRSKGMWISA